PGANPRPRADRARLFHRGRAAGRSGGPSVTLPPGRCGRLGVEVGQRTLIMGIINMAAGSFSGDGLGGDGGAAGAAALRRQAAGACLLDVGGRSTRPGAPPVEVAEELRLAVPAVRRVAGAGLPVSIDTFSSRVAAAALDAGAVMVNDVSGLRRDPEMARLVAA